MFFLVFLLSTSNYYPTFFISLYSQISSCVNFLSFYSIFILFQSGFSCEHSVEIAFIKVTVNISHLTWQKKILVFLSFQTWSSLYHSSSIVINMVTKARTFKNPLGSFSFTTPYPFSKSCHFCLQNMFLVCLLFILTANTLFQPPWSFAWTTTRVSSVFLVSTQIHLWSLFHIVGSSQIISFPCLKSSSDFPCLHSPTWRSPTLSHFAAFAILWSHWP